MTLTAGWFFARTCLDERQHDLLKRSFHGWMGLAILAFFIPYPAAFFAAAGVLVFSLRPSEEPAQIGYYCALLPALPLTIGWQIPFPGLNYLFVMDYPMLLNLALLIPLLGSSNTGAVTHRQASRSRHTATAGIFTLGMTFLILAGILDFRETSLSNGARLFFENFLSIGLLILAFSKLSQKQGNYADSALLGLLIAGFLLSSLGLMQQALQWVFYTNVQNGLLVNQMWHDYRGGSFRVPLTMSPIPAGIVLSICIGTALYFKNTGVLKRNGAITIFLFGAVLFSTGSRGAVLSLGMLLLALFLLSPRLRAVAPFILVFAILLGVVAATLSSISDLFVGFDEFGTFQYRIELIEYSIPSIRDNFFFGSPSFTDHPMLLEFLRLHPAPILDVVNSFLAIALRYGIVGLVIYSIPLFAALAMLRRYRSISVARKSRNLESLYRHLLSIILAYAAASITVSYIDRLEQIYWLLICIAGLSMSTSDLNPDNLSEPACQTFQHNQ